MLDTGTLAIIKYYYLLLNQGDSHWLSLPFQTAQGVHYYLSRAPLNVQISELYKICLLLIIIITFYISNSSVILSCRQIYLTLF